MQDAGSKLETGNLKPGARLLETDAGYQIPDAGFKIQDTGNPDSAGIPPNDKQANGLNPAYGGTGRAQPAQRASGLNPAK